MTQEKKTILVLAVLIAVIAGIYFAFGDPAPSPVTETVTRLEKLEQAVKEFSLENKRLPKTLAELELEEEAIKDHKGAPFHFKADGKVVTISSFGADGRPGGSMFNADQSVEFESPTE